MNIEELDPEFLAIGAGEHERQILDKAIIGVGRRCGQEDALVYSRARLVRAFMELHGWDCETADEWISYNVEGAYLGPRTPIIMGEIEHEH